MGVTVKLQIHQEGSGRVTVGNQITHERVDNVRINLHLYSKDYYSNLCAYSNGRD